MRRLIFFALLTASVSGCARPVIIENGTQSRVFTPCTNDNLCIRDSYNVAWDSFCYRDSRDYPVTYRSKQYEYESNRVEYILLPENALAQQEGGAR